MSEELYNKELYNRAKVWSAKKSNYTRRGTLCVIVSVLCLVAYWMSVILRFPCQQKILLLWFATLLGWGVHLIFWMRHLKKGKKILSDLTDANVAFVSHNLLIDEGGNVHIPYKNSIN